MYLSPPKNLRFWLFIIVVFPISAFSQLLENPEEKIDSLRKEVLIKKRTNAKELTELYYQLALFYNKVQNDSAKFYAKKFLTEIDNNDYENKIKGNFELMRYFFHRDDYQSADSINRVLYKLVKNVDTYDWLFRIQATRAIGLSLQNKRDSSNIYFDKAKALISKVENPKYIADYYQFRGLAYRIEGKYKDALNSNLLAIDYYKDNNEYVALGAIYHNIGTLNALLRDFKNALLYFRKARVLYENIGDRKSLCNTIISMGACYVELKNYNEGHKYYEKALDIANELNIPTLISYVYSRLGHLNSLQKNQEKAVFYHKKSLQITYELKEYEGYVVSALGLAKSYLKKKDIKNASVFIDDAIEVCENQDMIIHQPYAFHLKAKIDSVKGDFKSAFENHKLSQKFQDSLEKIQNREKFEELQIKYETAEKEKELEKLNAEKKTNELKLIRQRYENYSLSGGIFLLLLISGGLYYRYREKGKLSQQLQSKNDEIASKNIDLEQKRAQLEAALEEREILIREIHHRVKNNLQLISSMLNLQSSDYQNEEISNFLERSQVRISSMALVHQTLYNNKNTGPINFKDYLKLLISGIYDSFDFKNKKIDFSITTPGKFLDLDTTINLGMIVNELVYNSFKHGFKGKESGKLTIDVYTRNTSFEIIISDNGVGIPDVNGKNGESFGLRLVDLIIRQLGGELNIQSDNSGTVAKVKLKLIGDQSC